MELHRCSVKGFITLVKQVNENVVTTHCFLHREILVSKSLCPDLQKVSSQVMKMVNFVKSRPLRPRVFSQLYKNLSSNHISLLLHTEVRWLSRGKVLTRVFELKNELLIFFRNENQHEFCKLLNDINWISKFAYLVDVFSFLNKVNTSMQGKGENLLTSVDKINSLKDKLNMWLNKMRGGVCSMFPFYSSTNNLQIVPIIIKHLQVLQEKIDHYFPNISSASFDWVRNPFSITESTSLYGLTVQEEEELIDLKNNRSIISLLQEVGTDKFWLKMRKDFPNLAKKATVVLIQFSTSYLCEFSFSFLTSIKSKKRERLLSVEEEMRVALSEFPPNIDKLCANKQAQISH